MLVACRWLMIAQPAEASDCSVLWALRLANLQTPSEMFRNWHAVNASDWSCCTPSREWTGLRCTRDAFPRVQSLTLELQKPLPAQQRLTTIPPEIADLAALGHMSVRMANLSTLPASFGRLCTLAMFICIDCGLQSLPDVFSNCSHLDYLYIPNNPSLRSLPRSLSATPITWLEMSYTGIEDLGPVCDMRLLTNLVCDGCNQLRCGLFVCEPQASPRDRLLKLQLGTF